MVPSLKGSELDKTISAFKAHGLRQERIDAVDFDSFSFVVITCSAGPSIFSLGLTFHPDFAICFNSNGALIDIQGIKAEA